MGERCLRQANTKGDFLPDSIRGFELVLNKWYCVHFLPSCHLKLSRSPVVRRRIRGQLWTGFPGGARDKELARQCRRCKRHRVDPWVGKIPWRRAWQPTPVFLPGESHGQRAWRAAVHRVRESDTAEQLGTGFKTFQRWACFPHENMVCLGRETVIRGLRCRGNDNSSSSPLPCLPEMHLYLFPWAFSL